MNKPLQLFIVTSLILLGCASPCENESTLKELARESVSSKLKAPSTAKFSDESVQPSKDGQGLLVTGNVDAQNAFGAQMREEYTVNVKCSEGEPYVAYAWMGATFWGTEHQAEVDSILSR